jgi:hypothetical protein
MKKVTMILAIFVLLAGMGSSEVGPGMWGEFIMKNEPLGWNGWAWGTSFEEVKGWLNRTDELSVPFLRDLQKLTYTRQGQDDVYFGQEWEDTRYIFEKEKLCGVLLETNSTKALADLMIYRLLLGKGNMRLDS